MILLTTVDSFRSHPTQLQSYRQQAPRLMDLAAVWGVTWAPAMILSYLDQWLPIVTLILGAVLTFIFGLILARYQRSEDRKDNRNKLQREELKDLQFAA